MITYNAKYIGRSAAYALVASCVTITLLFTTFFLAEPVISHGQSDQDTFTINQVITDESALYVATTSLGMIGSINGVTGGQATGTTQFSVVSNNTAGYYVDITFDYQSGTYDEAMVGNSSLSEAIRDYSAGSTTPSYGYTASTAAQFAYTVSSDDPNDTDQSFLNNSSICDAGSTQTVNACWKAPSSTAFRIVDASDAAVTGATSTITFNVTVPSGATPVPQAETYTATATLSLYVK